MRRGRVPNGVPQNGRRSRGHPAAAAGRGYARRRAGAAEPATFRIPAAAPRPTRSHAVLSGCASCHPACSRRLRSVRVSSYRREPSRPRRAQVTKRAAKGYVGAQDIPLGFAKDGKAPEPQPRMDTGRHQWRGRHTPRRARMQLADFGYRADLHCSRPYTPCATRSCRNSARPSSRLP